MRVVKAIKELDDKLTQLFNDNDRIIDKLVLNKKRMKLIQLYIKEIDMADYNTMIDISDEHWTKIINDITNLK